MMQKLADGSWLTTARMRIYGLLSGVVSLLVLAFLSITAEGTVDIYGRPLGTDFSNVWAAGRMALDGAAAQAWSWPEHFAVQQAAHGGNSTHFYGWHYPPPFLIVAALLATIPYGAALAFWQASTMVAALVVLRRIVPHSNTLLLGLTAPIVFVCLGHGQNGFLTAALLGGGLFLLDKRPVASGLLLGCLIYKPQFALLIPPLLIVSGNWRALFGAAASASILILITLVLWGLPVWHAFFGSLSLTQQIVVESGATGWEKIHSLFAMVRMWGGSIGAAYAVQGVATGISIGLALWLTRRGSAALRNAAAMAAALISTPYVLDYDFVVLGLGAAFLIQDGLKRGFLNYEKSLLALIWVAPLFARQLAALTLLPLGQITALLLLGLAVRRAIKLDEAFALRFRSSPCRH